MAQIKNSTIYKNLYLLPSKHTRTHKRSLNGQCYTQYFRYLKNYQIYVWYTIPYHIYIYHTMLYIYMTHSIFMVFLVFILYIFFPVLWFSFFFSCVRFLILIVFYSCVCVCVYCCYFSQSLTRRLKREIDFPQSHNVIFIFISSVSMSFAFFFAFFYSLLSENGGG